MQTADVDLLDIDPLGLVEDEPVWSARRRSLEHLQGRHRQQDHAGDGARDFGAKDKLGLGKRIHLNPGEKLRGSGFVKLRDSYNGGAVAMASIDTPNGRQVRLGIVNQSDLRKWSGHNRGATVQLNETGISDLRNGVAGLADKVRRTRIESGELLERRWETADPADIALFNEKTGGVWEEGVLASGPWGDLIWRTLPDLEVESAREVTATVELHVRPPNAPEDWAPDIYEGGIVLQERDVPKLQAKLTELLGAARTSEALRMHAASSAVHLMAPGRALEHLRGRHDQDKHGGDGIASAADKLKLGRLAPAGISVRSSKKVKTDFADIAVAELDGPDGPQVRVGLITAESGRWDAGFSGEDRKTELRQQIAQKQALFESEEEQPDDLEDEISELEGELETLENERTAILAPEAMADFRRQLDEALTLAKANKAKQDAVVKALDTIDAQSNKLVDEFSDAELERKISDASGRLRSRQKTIKRLENDPDNYGWGPEKIAELIESHKTEAAKQEAELRPLLARRAELVPPDALAKLEDLDRQYLALTEDDIDDILTSVEVSAPNGTRVRAEIWGSDDEDTDWVSAKLYVLGPGETTEDADNGDDFASFRGLKELNKLLAGLDAPRTPESVNRFHPEVRSMPDVRTLEAARLFSGSPAVQLIMYARALEAIDTVMRGGKAIKVNRGKGGKFAKKGVSDHAQAAVAAALDPGRRRAAFDRVDASFDRDWTTTGAANSRSNAQRRFVSGEPAGDIAADLRREADELEQRANRGDILGSEGRGGRQVEPEELALMARSDAKRLRRLADNLERESGPSDPAPEPPAEPSPPAPGKARRSAVAKALASGDPSALDGMNREALRREAKARGLEPRRGVTEDELRDMLWDDEQGSTAADGGGASPPTIGGSDDRNDPFERAAAISGMADVWGAARKQREETSAATPKPGRPTRARTAADPVPHTIGARTSTSEENAIAIMGGKNVWALRGKPASSGPAGQATGSVPTPSAPDAVRKSTTRARVAGPSPEIRAHISSIIAAPKSGDRERLRGIFNTMTIPQLKQWAADNGVFYDRTGPKSLQVDRLVEHTIGFRLNSHGIRHGVSDIGRGDRPSVAAAVPEPAPKTGLLTDRQATETFGQLMTQIEGAFDERELDDLLAEAEGSGLEEKDLRFLRERARRKRDGL